ncbi:MAG: hypothetical protein LBR89_02860, partial [Holosporales bacterium]|nr:hypothetical protein [Holosporales bacterium]
ENREHVEALIAHTAKFLGQEKFSARIAGALIKRSAEVGLKVGGVVSESGLEARDIIDQPLQEVHIDKHNVVALPLLDTIALCGASSEFVILKRQAFNAMRSKGMTTQEAMKKLNEPKTKQALEKVAQYVSDKVAEAEKQEFANTQLYVDALEDEVEPTLLDSLLQGASVDLSSVAPEQLPLLEDVIAERFCDQSEHTDLMLHILTTELPDDVREIAQDYVTERVEMQATGSVRILTRVGQALKTVGQITAVGAAHLLDPIPGAPIGKGVEVLTGVSTPHEAYKDIGKDAAVDAGVMTTMGAVPFIPGVGAVVGKVMQNMGKAWNAGKRVLLKNSSLLRKVETRLAERTSKTGSSGPERIREAVNRNLKLHKNDLRYKGKTHVYQIVDTESGEIWKIGESARGVDKLGQSIRAQEQVRNLGRMYNKRFKSEILQIFDGKAAARAHETNLIKVLREKGQSLPGNKGVH